ncbi:MAG: threonine--tRNA ligase [Deltaproteobacteria bacterium]|nr:threonine--tRNA ligase [Deltaproteobacteria bacterium]
MTTANAGSQGRTVRRWLEERGERVNDVVAVVRGGDVLDLMTVVEDGADLQPLRAGDEKALAIVRHTAAHVMADAVQRLFPGTKVTIGPSIADGFYYDFDRPEGAFTEEDLSRIEETMREIVKADATLERSEVTRAEAEELFTKLGEPYKLEILRDLPADASITLYRHGQWTDLCRGPHVASTGWVKAFKLTGVAGAYWRGDERNKMLSRIYGTAFFDKKALAEHLARIEEAKKRDHRKLGRELDLYSTSDAIGGGLVLWHPKGAFVRRQVEDYWRAQHLAHGYELLFSPHIGRAELWQKSGHLGFYKENMYAPMEIEGNPYILKPMNCPFHIEIYRSRLRSYRELPLRWAELGAVYRFERSGQLHGLMRVRGFTQDDAHLFIRREQLGDEIIRVIDFSTGMLKAFGFEQYQMVLSTRPKESAGDPELWAEAERHLRLGLEKTGLGFEVEEGGGAFYGPKIDIQVKDALGRSWQCSTIQADFIQPENFDLSYAAADGTLPRPVMLHRTLLGSMERFFGVLVEHLAGGFPPWLAPVQATVVTVSEKQQAWGREVGELCRARGLRVHVDDGSDKLGAKIREARNQRVPYIAVVGDREAAERTVTPRSRAEGDLGAMPVDAFVERLASEAQPPKLELRYS